ncbi:hypothetical protein J2Y55_003145 [Bosea sp. BE125]|nr:hypothetical protein [Bosea sp. BE125]
MNESLLTGVEPVSAYGTERRDGLGTHRYVRPNPSPSLL